MPRFPVPAPTKFPRNARGAHAAPARRLRSVAVPAGVLVRYYVTCGAVGSCAWVSRAGSECTISVSYAARGGDEAAQLHGQCHRGVRSRRLCGAAYAVEHGDTPGESAVRAGPGAEATGADRGAAGAVLGERMCVRQLQDTVSWLPFSSHCQPFPTGPSNDEPRICFWWFAFWRAQFLLLRTY